MRPHCMHHNESHQGGTKLNTSHNCLPLPSNTSASLSQAKQHHEQTTHETTLGTDMAFAQNYRHYLQSQCFTHHTSEYFKAAETVTRTVTCSRPPVPSLPCLAMTGLCSKQPFTMYIQAMDILLLPVLLQPLQAHGRPHEVHSGQRHEGNKDICYSHGARSGGISHIWHDSGWERPGRQDLIHCWSLHGMLSTHYVYYSFQSNFAAQATQASDAGSPSTS